MLSLFMDRELRVSQRQIRVLHVSPELGVGRKLSGLANIDYTSIDLSRSGVTLRCDLQDLPFPSGRFDLVISSHVLEHVDDDRAAMSEMARVTSPGGVALIMVPVDTALAETYEDPSITTPEDRKAAFGQRDHVRMFGNDVAQRLAQAGVQVESIDYASRLPADLVQSMGLVAGTDLIYSCSPAT